MRVLRRIIDAYTICRIAGVAIALGIASAARAQCPPDCIDTVDPTVTVSPSGVQSSSSVAVTIDWRDNGTLDGTSRSIVFDGSNVTASFSYNEVTQGHATSTGSIALTPGQHTLVATISDDWDNSGSRTQTYVFGVWVTPHSANVGAHQGSNGYAFTVQNTGSSSATLSLSPDCTGVTSCSLSSTSLTLNGGASDVVTLTYNAGAIGTGGTARLKAWYASNSAARDSGAVSITVQNGFTAAFDKNVSDNQNLALCANDCFVPVYAQGTVPYFSLGAPRNLSLVYHGERVALRPFVYADVTSPFADDPVTQYTLRVLRGGSHVSFTNGDTALTFQGSSQPVRLAGQLDLQSDTTAVSDIQIIVKAQFASRQEEQSSSTKLLVVNERKSPLARGWTIGGLQRLRVQSDGSVILSDGSGSAMRFTSCGTGCFTAPSGEFSTVSSTGTGTSTVYTRAFIDSTKVRFNYLGYMTAVRNRFGDSTVFEYDASWRLSKVRDPIRVVQSTGERAYLELTYNGYGLAQIKEPGPNGEPGGGRATAFTVASDSTLTAIQDPDGASTRFLYTAQRELERVVNRRGDTSRFYYHALFRTVDSVATPRVAIDTGGGNTEMRALVTKLVPWRTRGVPATSTVGSAAAPVLQSDLKAAITAPGMSPATYTADRWGQPLAVTDAEGKTTIITRSGVFAVKIVGPTGAVDSSSYNTKGQLIYNRAPAGIVTTIQYGAWGRPTQIASTGQPTVTYTYGSLGRDSLVTADGKTTAYETDTRGRITKVTDPSSHVTQYRYETRFGHLDSTSFHGGQWMLTRFDQYGRDSVRIASGQSLDTTRYDGLNRVTRVASGLDGRATSFGYDSVFQTTVTDAHGKVWREDLNPVGWTTRRYDPTNAFTAYTYDMLGRVRSVTNRRGQRIDFAYDSLGRLLSRTGTNVMAAYFEYDSLGRFIVGRNAVSVDTAFTNTQTGWTDSVVTRLGGRRFRIRYRPDATQRLDSVTIAQDGASPIAFLPRKYFWNSSTGQLDSIKVNGRRFKYRRNGEALVDTVTYPSAVRLGVSYTSVHQVKGLSYSTADLDSLLKRTYGYDSLGRVVSEVKPVTSTSEHRRTFGYDRLGQLTSLELAQAQETCTTPPNVPEGDYGDICALEATPYKVYGFHYDSVYNLRREVDSTASVTTSSTLESPNRQMAWGSVTYGYDADGNRASKTGDGGAVTYHWTADGLLDTVTVGTVTLAYDYNAFGQLVRRSRNGTVERHFLWDRGQLLAELDGTAGARIAEYAYGPGVDAPIAMVAGSDTASMRYLHRDALGNVAAVTNQSGGIVQQLDYAPWGTLEAITGALADTNRLRWKGLVWEGDSTRLYYVRARWYDPVSRRFISEDPSGLAGGVNQYAFASNDPVGKADATGMYECWVKLFTDGDCNGGGSNRGVRTLGFAGNIGMGWGNGDAIDRIVSEAAECGAFDQRQCDRMKRAISRLEGHGDPHCRDLGRTARARWSTGGYLYNERQAEAGLAWQLPLALHIAPGRSYVGVYRHRFISFGPGAFVASDLALRGLIAHEETHLLGGDQGAANAAERRCGLDWKENPSP